MRLLEGHRVQVQGSSPTHLAVMAGRLVFSPDHSLDKATVPHQQISHLSARQDLQQWRQAAHADEKACGHKGLVYH